MLRSAGRPYSLRHLLLQSIAGYEYFHAEPFGHFVKFHFVPVRLCPGQHLSGYAVRRVVLPGVCPAGIAVPLPSRFLSCPLPAGRRSGPVKVRINGSGLFAAERGVSYS